MTIEYKDYKFIKNVYLRNSMLQTFADILVEHMQAIEPWISKITYKPYKEFKTNEVDIDFVNNCCTDDSYMFEHEITHAGEEIKIFLNNTLKRKKDFKCLSDLAKKIAEMLVMSMQQGISMRIPELHTIMQALETKNINDITEEEYEKVLKHNMMSRENYEKIKIHYYKYNSGDYRDGIMQSSLGMPFYIGLKTSYLYNNCAIIPYDFPILVISIRYSVFYNNKIIKAIE